MNVLKFGGSSVGSPEPLRNVKNIIESHKEGVIVVASALGGITDQLLDASCRAAKGDESFRDIYAAIRLRHHNIINECTGAEEGLIGAVDGLLEQLRTLLEGVFSLRVLPERTRCEIVSFGERMSSLIVTAMIPGATRYDALDFIRTTVR
ncbi:MAG: bifunctional aspartate kinase/homoserine dehydrogenase I, partial [Bacteroidales bacterium]|nr:bifunctional aspartate kinase/homoserine dehydrogenase I [Bacteroidales bacterium]